MQNVIICGDQVASDTRSTFIRAIEIAGMPITVGLIETLEPVFDLHTPENRARVIVKIRALSCNYRDKAIILMTGQRCQKGAFYSFIGSEFVADVLAIGPDVTKLQVGDRVMADNQFPGLGMPTNYASKRHLLLHEANLIKVPPGMSDEVAAAFSLGAQTSYSILRKLQIQHGKNVLVTAATSNTSLFVIHALKQYDVNVYVTTTSKRHENDLMQMGATEVIPIDPNMYSLRDNKGIEKIVLQNGGFDYLIDPFFDLYLNKIIDVMAMEGKYISCGFADQYSHITGNPLHSEGRPLQELMTYAIVKNIQIIANCLGKSEDLQQAIQDYSAGILDITIDSVFRGDQVAAFFERTYNAQDRFGKVVYCYDD